MNYYINKKSCTELQQIYRIFPVSFMIQHMLYTWTLCHWNEILYKSTFSMQIKHRTKIFVPPQQKTNVITCQLHVNAHKWKFRTTVDLEEIYK
jgi:hypothetical protein